MWSLCMIKMQITKRIEMDTSCYRFQRKEKFIPSMKETPRTGMHQQPSNLTLNIDSFMFYLIWWYILLVVRILNTRYVEKCKFPTDGSAAKSLRYIGRYVLRSWKLIIKWKTKIEARCLISCEFLIEIRWHNNSFYTPP